MPVLGLNRARSSHWSRVANPTGSGKGGEACALAKVSLGIVLKGFSSQTGMLPNPGMADLEHQYSSSSDFVRDSVLEVGFWELAGLLLLLMHILRMVVSCEIFFEIMILEGSVHFGRNCEIIENIIVGV